MPWALHRLRQHPALCARDAATLVGPGARLQHKHCLHVIALEWGAADWPTLVARLTGPRRAAVAALRGALVDGQTSEDVARVGSVLRDWIGAPVVCCWAYVDMWGAGGDSQLYLLHETAAGPALGPLPDGLWDFLTHPGSTVDPETFRDRAGIPFSARAARAEGLPCRMPLRADAYNYAWVIDRTRELD